MRSLALLLALAAASCALPRDAGVAAALAHIDADEMLRHIQVLASDAFEGRAPGTRGEDLTVDYLVAEFKRLGLRPGHPDGSYVQRVPLVASRGEGSLAFTIGGRTVDMKVPADAVVSAPRKVPVVDIRAAELVFVGHGVVAPEHGWDDFKGIDLRGKVVLTLANDPQVPDPADPSRLDRAMFQGAGVTVHGLDGHKSDVARQRGALARIGIFEPGLFGSTSWTNRIRNHGIEELGTQESDAGPPRLSAVAQISPDAARRLLAAAGHDLDALRQAARQRDFVPLPLGVKVDIGVKQTLRRIESRNVVARVEGSDPVLKDEVVLYTAHWDHLGRLGPQIFNGARDNASGVAAMLEVAQAFAALPVAPRRSIVFLATTAEERGLLGAKHYAEHPLYPLERTLAVLNIDIVNVWGRTRDLNIIGYGRSTLADGLARLARSAGRSASDQTRPEAGVFYRSDHYEFARKGVPAVYLQRGLDYIDRPEGWGRQESAAYFANVYHRVGDKVQLDWDLSGAVEDCRLYFRLGHDVAQAERWPAWHAGDEFEAVRDASLKAAAR